MKIPMSSPLITDEDMQAVLEVLQTPHLSLGPKTKEFESALATYTGTEFGISVNSGTSGLHLAVVAAGIGENDLVITTPYSFIASANCLIYENAIPVFVDIDAATYNIDPIQVAEVIADIKSGGEKSKRWLPRSLQGILPAPKSLKGLIVVDTYGQPANYDQLRVSTKEYDLFIIEDSCESLGAEYKGRKAGSLGDVGIFGFYPNKQLTTGEGGMLVTDRPDWAESFRSLRNQGRNPTDTWLNHTQLGYNYRLDEMSAALGLSQLSRVESILESRERVAGWYNNLLKDIPEVQIPKISSTTTRMSWFVYHIRVLGSLPRDQVMKELSNQGIPSRPYFSPIHLQPYYRDKFGYKLGDFPEAELAGQQCLTLPFSSVMSEDQVDYVCKTLKSILAAGR
jgi:dTDP-4-amino-4,6-dideoxygalactose transaminase